MRRHDLDPVSLVAGLVFLGFAAAYLLSALTGATLDARYVWPIVLVALGAAGLATAVRANAREERAFTELQESRSASE